MKIIFLMLTATIFLTACNSSPVATGTPEEKSEPANTNSTELWKPESETPQVEQPVQNETAPSLAKKSPKASTQNSTQTKPQQESSVTGTESGTEATEKQGWSKTAKGAVIGGVVGAGTGAVVNKKNRAAGAVIGGVVGAGAGAIIGNEMDKKDGRH